MHLGCGPPVARCILNWAGRVGHQDCRPPMLRLPLAPFWWHRWCSVISSMSTPVLAPQTLMASILKKDEAAPVPVPAGLTGRERPVSRPVQPEAWPQTSSHKSTRLVYQPSPAASVSQPALGRTESGPCSDQPADGCVCQDSPLAGIQICYVPKGALDNEPTQTAKSGQVARR